MDTTTLDPSQICENVLSYIKKSNLNFFLSETPFSLTLNLKKAFLKDKNGILQSPAFSEVDNKVGRHFSQNYMEENKSLKQAIVK